MIRTSIESGIKAVRETCSDAVKTVQEQKKPIDNFVATGIEHSQCELNVAVTSAGMWMIGMTECVDCLFVIAVIYDFLNEPSNGIHRAGAIGVGALSGYIIGIRSGFIRRLLYTSIGGLGIASVCYPKEASQYSQQAIAEAKTYATIVYNFAYGGLFTTHIHRWTDSNRAFLFILQSNQAMSPSRSQFHHLYPISMALWPTCFRQKRKSEFSLVSLITTKC